MRLTSRGLLLGLGVILALRLLAMTLMPLADTSEPRYAEIARLMAASGDWITPWFEPGVPFWGKPPLAFWAPALSIRLLGLSELAVRLPSWLAMLGVLALVHACGRRLHGEQAARWATLLFATMLLPFASAGAVLTDAFLALGITLSMVSFLLAPREPRPWWRYGFFAGLTIGLLSRAAGGGADGRRDRAVDAVAPQWTRTAASPALGQRHRPDADAGAALVHRRRTQDARLPALLHHR